MNHKTVKSNLKTIIPDWMVVLLRPIKRRLALVAYSGNDRTCCVCGRQSRRFAAFGRPARPEARCIYCEALERHRLLWFFLQRRTDLFDGKGKKVIHFAPEPCLEPLLASRLGSSYVTADLLSARAMLKRDICGIDDPDESYDVILCSHVLEHVADDKQAMREFRRVLKRDGWAAIMVPVIAEKTFEDAAIVDPADRLREYGQEDHVRRYGLDFADRLRDQGFTVIVVNPADLAGPAEIRRLGFGHAAGNIFFCTK